MRKALIILAAGLCALACNGTGGGDTPQPQQTIEAVDLSLSVKWGSANLNLPDATAYYAWGDTSVRRSSDVWNYTHWKGNKCLRYNTDVNYSVWDKLKTLEKQDDAALAALGKGWHIPTEAEWNELLTCCKWQWVSGSNPGYKVTSKYNGGTIFLPAEGFVIGTDVQCKGECGYYWSASLPQECPIYATALSFDCDSASTASRVPRVFGLSIRPVHD